MKPRFSHYWLIVLVCSLVALVSNCHAQTFLKYREMFCGDRPCAGTHFVLVTADWCAACEQLKAQIPAYQTIYVVDYDRDRRIADVILRGRPLPMLVRYETTPDGRSWRRTWLGTKLAAFFDRPNEPRITDQRLKYLERKIIAIERELESLKIELRNYQR